MNYPQCQKCNTFDSVRYFESEDGIPGGARLCVSCYHKIHTLVFKFIEDWIEQKDEPKSLSDLKGLIKPSIITQKDLEEVRNKDINSCDSQDDCSGHSCDCFNHPY